MSERVLTVSLRKDVILDAPPRAVWKILSKVPDHYHKIDPLCAEPLTPIDRHVRSTEVTEWKLKGNRATLIGRLQTELIAMCTYFDMSVRINASNWFGLDVIVFQAKELEESKKTILTEERQIYLPWVIRVIFQSRITSEAEEQVQQNLKNAVALVETVIKKEK
jgi:hypothetical protein